MGLFTGEDDKNTKDYNDKLVRNSPTERVRDGIHSVGDSLRSFWQQAMGSDENPFSDLWLNASGGLGDVLAGLGLPGGFAHPSRIRTLMDDTREEEGVTGLYGYRTPTNSQFEECQEVKGLSVWDSHGLWRCLFPESVVRTKVQPGQLSDVVTREKVENDNHHNLGLFFTEYSSYLTWRSHMLRLAERRRKEARESLETWRSPTPEDLTDLATGKKVVGTSEYVTYNTTDNGQEQIKETKTYYDDGTVRLRSEKRHTSPDGGKPKVESVEKLLTQDEAKDGWFWRRDR
ncbi:LAFE_0F08548g1_1 [Lachancea fermentati]|uniref:LAFE_0F08548g1_1 n=1 Tax=Lachancea fermentati TaxID=4955 RepID=A0A1G4MF31_LACFM|nr:LAFE_0F08548g1_1 [Lachancea fermentati]